MPYHTQHKIEMALKHLPKDLEDLYREILSEINKQGSEEREMAHRILRWLSCAKRPLTVSEVVHISAIEEDISAIDPARIPSREKQIVNICRNLVKVNTQPSVMDFIHSSVKDILVQRGPQGFDKYVLGTEPEIHRSIAEDCLKYISLVFRQPVSSNTSSVQSASLSSDLSASCLGVDSASSASHRTSLGFDLADLVLENARDIRPDLLEYATKFWSWHASKSKFQGNLQSLILCINRFFVSSAAQCWIDTLAGQYEGDGYQARGSLVRDLNSVKAVRRHLEWISEMGGLVGILSCIINLNLTRCHGSYQLFRFKAMVTANGARCQS